MPTLFSPLTIRHLTLRNRVAMPPMVCAVVPALGMRANDDGTVTEGLLAHYARRAKAGTGLIIVEAAAVDPAGRCWLGGIGAYDDAHAPGLAALAKAIRDAGAVAAIQLVHGGPQGSSELNGGVNVGPSPLELPGRAGPCRALTLDEIAAVQDRFAAAAHRCAQAGFQVIELHAAHGFLLDSFLMKTRNLRTDEYGGSRANRMRMLLETCDRVKARLGGRALLDCRISVFNKREEGDPVERLEALVRALAAAGVDVLHLSTDGALNPARHVEPEMGRTAGAVTETFPTLGQIIKAAVDLPLIVAGGLGDPDDANRAIRDGHADLAAVGRAMLDDPEWTEHAYQALVGG
jgi:2,4-dienoyl-CoA reductase-like NADH-dependent reductase (Old Yellow Enzyme family)